MMKMQSFENWRSILQVCRQQVQRAVDSVEEFASGERGLATVAIAAMLEAYINFWVPRQFGDGQYIVPKHLHDALLSHELPFKHKYRVLPRYVGRADEESLMTFEQHQIHDVVERIFAERNKFVHGDVDRWKPWGLTPQELTKLWNSALDLLVLLETLGGFRIPRSRHEDYQAEIDSFKVHVHQLATS